VWSVRLAEFMNTHWDRDMASTSHYKCTVWAMAAVGSRCVVKHTSNTKLITETCGTQSNKTNTTCSKL